MSYFPSTRTSTLGYPGSSFSTLPTLPRRQATQQPTSSKEFSLQVAWTTIAALAILFGFINTSILAHYVGSGDGSLFIYTILTLIVFAVATAFLIYQSVQYYNRHGSLKKTLYQSLTNSSTQPLQIVPVNIHQPFKPPVVINK